MFRKSEKSGCLLWKWLPNFASTLFILATIPKYQKVQTSFLDQSGKRSKTFVKLITNKQTVYVETTWEELEKNRGERPQS